ncbi:hypothetical protein V499_00806 [Pseudogymnoascus sp. VKM F-103]|nr:hypothetical protein V499_00806 [Pseudogymnoascus sp. VKM F-103]
MRLHNPFSRSSRSNELPSTKIEPTLAPYGMVPLAEGSGSIVADLVFIHGVTGNRIKTWKAPDAAGPWPSELLAKDIANVRILAWGYDADIVNLMTPAGQNRIGNHARDLLTDLESNRINDIDRPIIFVVHSLGGLVVEDAICISRSSPKSEQGIVKIEECTQGILFMGTPQCGSDASKLAAVAAGFANYFRTTNKSIINLFDPKSEVLARVQASFHERIRSRSEDEHRPMRLFVFYEDREMVVLGKSFMIVPKESAIINGYGHASLPADHSTMTKFASKSDPGYERVKNKLLAWTRQFEEPISKPIAAADATRRHWDVGGSSFSGTIQAGGNVQQIGNIFQS